MSSAARSVSLAGGSGRVLLLSIHGLIADRSVHATRSLVGCASRLLLCGLGYAFLRAEVLGQVIQKGVAIGVGDDGAEAFHFFQLFGPLLAGQVVLGDAGGVVGWRGGGPDFGAHVVGRGGVGAGDWRWAPRLGGRWLRRGLR